MTSKFRFLNYHLENKVEGGGGVAGVWGVVNLVRIFSEISGNRGDYRGCQHAIVSVK